MYINSFIMSDRAQEVPVPIPIDPVPATFGDTTIQYPYMMYNERIGKSATFSNTRPTDEQFENSSGEYYRTQGYDTIPCNVGGSNSGGVATLYPYAELDNYYTDLEIYSPKGTFTLTIGNTLPTGKYVFQMLFWLGFDDALNTGTAYRGSVTIDGLRGNIVKQGTNGVIHAKVVDASGVIYQGARVNPYQTPYYRGNVVCIQVRYAFEIAEGDTTKTFSFGEGTEFSFTELYRAIKMWETTSDYAGRGSVWANCVFLLNLKVFTAA